MSTGSQKRTRTERVAALAFPPGMVGRVLETLRRGDVMLRLGLSLAAALVMLVATRSWAPQFPYRLGQVPARNIVARVEFEIPNLALTEKAREEARRQARNVYKNDPEPLNQLRAKLHGQLVELVAAAEFSGGVVQSWKAFLPPDKREAALAEQKQLFEQFRASLAGEGRLAAVKDQVETSFKEFARHGLLDQIPETGNQAEILVYGGDQTTRQDSVPVSDVRLGEVKPKLRSRLEENLQSPELAERVFTWLDTSLPTALTLRLDAEATKAVREADVRAVPAKATPFGVGDVLARAKTDDGAFQPIAEASLNLLKAEHEKFVAQRSAMRMINRSLATFGMYLALYTLCGFYIFFRDREVLRNLPRFCALLLLAVVAVVSCYWINQFDVWQAEIIPMLLVGMIVAIVYQQELALLVTAAIGLIVVFSVGQELPHFVILMAASATAVLLVGNIRSRRKLIYVGLCAGAVAALTTVGVGIVDEQPFGWQLLVEAARYSLWAVVTGFVMTGLLPFVESVFGVLTDISLLELGDVAHPLLQELVRRAPGTYNHSINVASIAEAAAEAIGANGLLVRVGAYFHDIGKMLKPGYFIENQGEEANRHDSLVPAMSTLIIIAHVKDGADLARQHHLPQSIIDFIQQHHGTTLIEYFYRRASQQHEEAANGDTVDESSFRYPGPRPQTQENGILMLADAVESASRTLVEPTPSRIENLVHELTMKRLLDGQLDESYLTLKQVATIEDSLVKSLTAVYHGRVKYPEASQRRA